MNRFALLSIVLMSIGFPVGALEAQQDGTLGFYRFPSLHRDNLVFVAEGDLWLVSASGGQARRLTTHPAEERNPRISPDGRVVAFTAEYEGPAEVYTMPLTGGLPIRHTYEADPSVVTSWTPSGEVMYTTRAFSGLPKPQMVHLDSQNGSTSLVPLFGVSEGVYNEDGSALYFVRPAFHNNVTKRYTGGTARDVWVFEDGAQEAVELTGDYDGESHSPMWWAGRVYFVTDRDGIMNVWSMDEQGRDLRQHTNHNEWDVRNPSLSDGRIVYQFGADLRLLDLTTGLDAIVPISLASDFDQLREKWVSDPMQYLTSAHLDPDGNRVVLTSRGRVFVAPVGDGRLVRASRKDSVRFRDVVFMPDGNSLLGLSDETGELEFTRIPANGVGDDTFVSRGGSVLRFEGVPSPDGRYVAYADNNQDLWIMEMESGQQHLVSENREGVGDFSWSPDGQWLAYTMAALNTFRQIKLHDVVNRVSHTVTSDRVNSFSPAWDPESQFLYFLSDRNLNSLVGSPWGSRQPEPFFDRAVEIFSVAPRSGLVSPFKPRDELVRSDTGAVSGVTPAIDVDGIERRVKQVPVPAGNYRDLSVNDGALFWVSRESGPQAQSHLMAVAKSNERVEPKQVTTNIRSYELSRNGKKLLVRRANNFHVIDAKPAGVSNIAEHQVDLSGWRFPIDVKDDWRQIFVDAWRLERDYFYDPGMHDVGWDAALQKYLPLVDRVTTREELSDVIGRMVGELSALHTSVRGGDVRSGPDNISVPTLGARLSRDAAAGGYRINYVYQTDPDYPDEMAPLADPDLGIRIGDIIVAVNGVRTLDVPHIGSLLRDQAGEQVLLSVRTREEGNQVAGSTRDVIVVPGANEYALRYADWVNSRREAVDREGEGKIGYVYLAAMGANDLNQWYRQFYPVFNRQGLIIDVRDNNGGNIDAFILEKLMRKAWMYWQGRVGEPYWNMHYAFRGHMVVLVDQNTASDGEAFAEGFRRLGLGKIIGTRTWGGEIWLSSVNRLSDGGLARAPMNGVYGPEGEWLIEQWGVEPDLVVDNLPHATFNGEDAQLDAAISYLLEQIAIDPRNVPPAPPYPSKRLITTTDGADGRGR